MKVVKFRDLKYIPASHEDPKLPGAVKKILFKESDFIKGHLQMINWAKVPVKRAFVPHYHEDMEEVFIIIKGRGKMTVDNQMVDLVKGDAVLVPVGAVHSLANLGKSDLEYLAIGVSLQKGGRTIVVE